MKQYFQIRSRIYQLVIVLQTDIGVHKVSKINLVTLQISRTSINLNIPLVTSYNPDHTYIIYGEYGRVVITKRRYIEIVDVGVSHHLTLVYF